MNAAAWKRKRHVILKKQGGQCLFCREFLPYEEATLDHIHKREHGGPHDRANLRVLCRDCHDVRHYLERLPLAHPLMKRWIFVRIALMLCAGGVPPWFATVPPLKKIQYWTNGRDWQAKADRPA